MSDVPSEIFREILVRLPAESLFRFRSVCKSWQSMIDEPSFVRSHTTNNHLTSPRLILGTWTGSFYSFPLDSLNYVNGEQTIHATHTQKLTDDMGMAMSVFEFSMALCNSLILFHHHPGNNWVIWNPLTGDFHELPKPDFIDGHTFPMGVGFGYDSRSDDYKVVWIERFTERDGAPRTLIYSLKLKSWRIITNCPFDIGYFNWGVYLNGSVHWMASGETIVALDLATEEYRELQATPPPPLPPPPPMESPKIVRSLYASGGYLVLNDAGYEEIGRAWVMRGYGTDEPVWVELCSADERIVFSGVKGHLRPWLLAYSNSERRLIMHHDNMIIRWDIENCCVKKVTIDGLHESITFLEVVPGSLFRFNGGGSTKVKRSEEVGSNRLELSATTIDCGCSSGGVMSRSGREILGTVFLIED